MNDFGFYFSMGWEHIMSWDAFDHILFITALAAIYMLKDWKAVLILITAFTVGHTITLALSSLQIVTAPTEWIEFLVPITIVITAFSNLFVKNFTPRGIRLNYVFALFFGLIHGLAYANTLRMIMASDQSFATSMFAFSIGLELGQILVVLLVLCLAQLLIQGMKINRMSWVIFISAVTMALSAQIAVKRVPGKEEERSGNHSSKIDPQEPLSSR